ncbi:MAG: hypothetical protein VXY47_06130, partial [Bacteroidota bacterium]|nr:hypothetical protein [Bacteroidota bacterium]
PKEKVVAVLDYLDDSPQIEIDETLSDLPDIVSEKAKNVTANANLEKTTFTSSFDTAKAAQQVLDELKKLEADEFENISLDNPKLIEEQNSTINQQLIDEQAQENKKASFGKDVIATASYSLKDRTALIKKIPSYQCKQQGVVRIRIKVSQKGKVVFYEVDPNLSSTNSECLLSSALNYAKQWRFSQDFEDELKKSGWVEFKFIKQ